MAIVTGGAGLLGVKFCHTLAAAGAQLVIADLNGSPAQALAEAINSEGYFRAEEYFHVKLDGTRALAVETDVTGPESVKQMVETALNTFGRLDILVNSAALDPKFDPQSLNSSEVLSHGSALPETGQGLGRFEDYPLEAWLKLPT